MISFNCGEISDLPFNTRCALLFLFHATLPDMDDDIIIIKEHYGQRALRYLLACVMAANTVISI